MQEEKKEIVDKRNQTICASKFFCYSLEKLALAPPLLDAELAPNTRPINPVSPPYELSILLLSPTNDDAP